MTPSTACAPSIGRSRGQLGADRFALGQPGQHVARPGPDDDGVGARAWRRACPPGSWSACRPGRGRCRPCRTCASSSGSPASAPAGPTWRPGPCADRADTSRAWSVRMIRQSALDQVGHQRRPGVVVAELDLVGDHRVVLVDDRDHRPAQAKCSASSAHSGSARGRPGRRASAAPGRYAGRARENEVS